MEDFEFATSFANMVQKRLWIALVAEEELQQERVTGWFGGGWAVDPLV